MNKFHTATALSYLGSIYREKGYLDNAVKYLENAVEFYRNVEDRQSLASAISNMGLIYRDKGDFNNALKHYEQALEYYKDIGNRQGVAEQLGNIGVILRNRGKLDNALTHFKEALELNKNIGYRKGAAEQLSNIGILLRDREDTDNALRYFRDALEIYKDIGYRKGVAEQLGNIGVIFTDNEEFDTALRHHKEALEIFKEIGYCRGMAPLEHKIKWQRYKIQRQEAELLQSRKMAELGIMASGLAHEINQPLQIILAKSQNCITYIERGMIEKNGIINELKQIASVTKRIDRIVNHLHMLSRERKPELNDVNVNEAIENSLIIFNQQLKNRGIAVELNLYDKLPPVKADMVQLEQVFINLINNARDALEKTDIDKKIAISTLFKDDQIQIRFHDNGESIPNENLDKIFNAFYTTKEKGMGLGLYISYDIIKNYGGMMTIEDSKIDKGKIFLITLPHYSAGE